MKKNIKTSKTKNLAKKANEECPCPWSKGDKNHLTCDENLPYLWQKLVNVELGRVNGWLCWLAYVSEYPDKQSREQLRQRLGVKKLDFKSVIPLISKEITRTIERLWDSGICNSHCKALYFCSKSKGHKGVHQDEFGLQWED